MNEEKSIDRISKIIGFLNLIWHGLRQNKITETTLTMVKEPGWRIVKVFTKTKGNRRGCRCRFFIVTIFENVNDASISVDFETAFSKMTNVFKPATLPSICYTVDKLPQACQDIQSFLLTGKVRGERKSYGKKDVENEMRKIIK